MFLQAAEHKYNNFITSAWGSQMCCFHPKALKDLHEEAVKETLEYCLEDREEVDEDDEYKEAVREASNPKHVVFFYNVLAFARSCVCVKF